MDIKYDGTRPGHTRAKLLDAAATVLAAKGFSNTRLSDIAKEMDMQAPSIYHYYRSRDGLLGEMMVAGAARLRERVLRALEELPDETTCLERLGVAVETHIRALMDQHHYARSMLRNSHNLSESEQIRVLDQIATYNDVWRMLIEGMSHHGQLRRDIDPDIAGMFVLGALNSATEWWDPEQGPIEPLILTAKSMVFNAVCLPH